MENKAVRKDQYMADPPPVPTQETGISGLNFDFYDGFRVLSPQDNNYTIKLIDRDTHVKIVDTLAPGGFSSNTRRYFVNYRLEVWETNQLVYAHDYDAKDKKVLLQFAADTLDKLLAWIPYAEVFRKKHGCELYVTVDKKYTAVFKAGYPEIHFVSARARLPADFYATYCVGLLAPQDNTQQQPADWRIVGLQKYCAYLLGLPPVEIRPRLLPSKKASSLCPKEPYVCIGTQATAQAKYWNNAIGWMETVNYLKELGYRVLCVDRERVSVNGIHGNVIPYGAEDFTGDRPIQELMDIISGAAFFIGVSDGPVWLAWGMGIPVILISGCTFPGTEFFTPYRVQQFHVCHSCFNDQRNEQKLGDFGSCPHHRGTDKEFECSRHITVEFMRDMIDRLIRDNAKSAVE